MATKKLSRKARKALRLADLSAVERTKVAAAKADAETIKSLAAAIADLDRRIKATEERAGIAGPKGEKGERGRGFWGN